MLFKRQVFIVFTLLLILPIVIFALVVYFYLLDGEKENLLEGRQSMLVQLGNNVDLIVDDAARSSLSILFNQQQLLLLRKYEATTSTLKVRTDENDIKNYLQSVVYRKQYIEGMTYISVNGHVFSSLHDSEYRDYIDTSLLRYMDEAKRSNGRAFLIFDEQLAYYTNASDGLLSLVRPIRDPLDTKVLGLMKVDFNKSYIDALIAPLNDGHYILRNRNGDVLMQDDEASLSLNCTYSSKQQNNQCLQVLSADRHIAIQYMLPNDYYKAQFETISRWIMLYVVFILLFSVVITYFIVRKMLKPLVVLKSYLATYERAKMPVEREMLEPYLSSYDGMIGDIDVLVNNIYDATKKNLEMEYKVRQSQMDPHFLFNTLEMLNMKALTNKDFAMSDMIVQLSKCFRYHIKKKGVEVTLQDEIQFAQAYLSLMELRFKNRLVVQWEVAFTHNPVVPKYLIQPLVENAIIHGMRDDGQPLHLTIVVQEQEHFVIQVVDDGRGIAAHRLRKITEKFDAPSMMYDDEMGIALVNIQKLLRYGLNEKNTIVIESEEEVGTTVTVRLSREENVG